MDSGKRQPGFFLLDGILAVFLLGAAALSFAVGSRLALQGVRLRQELETGSRLAVRLLEEGEDPPFPDPEWETETVLEPVPQLPGVMLRKICLTRRGKGRCCYARYEKK